MRKVLLVAVTLASFSFAGAQTVEQLSASIAGLQQFSSKENILCKMISFANPLLKILGDYKIPLPSYFAWVKTNTLLKGVSGDDIKPLGQGYNLYHLNDFDGSIKMFVYTYEIDKNNTELCIAYVFP
ncbi:hypothetical protein [Deinococcus ruber]|uniref:hypothetical protein n=1 Tax=Deinococcus ruber TaxID=1848197 RepID=UPI001663AC1A|nr:hypothetical protein [Deinococcus ruber]